MDYLTDWDSSQAVGNGSESLSEIVLAGAAIAMAGITPADVDLIILATSTPMTCLAVLVKSSPSWEPPEQWPLTSQQLAPGLCLTVTAAQYIRTGVYQNVY